ncbi:MAG: PASTA domain-containing protein [Actinobacteria bacterium]|nr:PASTA domain-containing protein [Actinomycetota bacterium]
MTGEKLAGRYLLKRRLAGGRFLSTYEAEDTALGTLVVVDILEAGAIPTGLEMKRLEEILDAATQVRGAHVASLYEWGRMDEDGPLFLVGERVEGASLMEVLEECGELPPPQAVEVTRASVEALAEAYGRGLFYIGLNPGQVVVRERGEVKLVRVGYGWVLEESEPLLAHRVSPYRAPETDGGLEGRRTSDVYALAAMIRRMLPREAASQRLMNLLDTAMDPLPRNRPSSPRLVLEELEASVFDVDPSRNALEAEMKPGAGGLSFLKDGVVPLKAVPPEGRKRGKILRNLFLVMLGGVALLACLAALSGTLSGGEGREAAVTTEEEEKKVALPDLQGLTEEEAQGTLESLGLGYECRRAPSRLWSAGRVAAQEPDEGSVLERGDKVLLVISSGREGIDAGGSDADGTGGDASHAGQAGSQAEAPSGHSAPPARDDSSGDPAPSVAPSPQEARAPVASEPAPSAPRAVPVLSALRGAAPLYVTMDAGRSHDPDGDIVRYVWHCGDGAVLEGVAVQHVFDPLVIPARFQVVLEVFDARGMSSSASVTLEVY